jgi:hypothetical protein
VKYHYHQGRIPLGNEHHISARNGFDYQFYQTNIPAQHGSDHHGACDGGYYPGQKVYAPKKTGEPVLPGYQQGCTIRHGDNQKDITGNIGQRNPEVGEKPASFRNQPPVVFKPGKPGYPGKTGTLKRHGKACHYRNHQEKNQQNQRR